MNETMGNKPNMSGRKDLGIRRLPKSGAIPVQSKGPTKTAEDGRNAAYGVSKDIANKLRKVMINNGMIKQFNLKPHVKVKGMPEPNINSNSSNKKGC